MATDKSSNPTPEAPDRALLEQLDSDTWASVLTLARDAMHTLEGKDETPPIRQLRSSPTSRLASGPMRKRLQTLIAKGGPLWDAMVEKGADDPSGPLAVLTGDREVAPVAAARVIQGVPQAQHDKVIKERERAKDRQKAITVERDEARKLADGARGRLRTLQQDLDKATEERDAAIVEADGLRRDLAATTAEREKALAREQRRYQSQIDLLTEELRSHRRELDEEFQNVARQREAEERRIEADRKAAAAPPPAQTSQGRRGFGLAVAGRPSTLPDDVEAGTVQAAKALLDQDRTIVIDGYNITRQHKTNFPLDAQRYWLVDHVRSLQGWLRVNVEILWDGLGGASETRDERNLVVRFSGAGITADDEIVFHVAAMPADQPVIVVTDDRELRARVIAHGADVIGTGAFLSATS